LLIYINDANDTGRRREYESPNDRKERGDKRGEETKGRKERKERRKIKIKKRIEESYQ
jgi:hypothetical protein